MSGPGVASMYRRIPPSSVRADLTFPLVLMQKRDGANPVTGIFHMVATRPGLVVDEAKFLLPKRIDERARELKEALRVF